MPTLKQLETLAWIVRTGSFEGAAARLNTAQSAISKRIQALEQSVGAAVFDRSQRSARLTEYGEHILALGEEMLALQQRMIESRTDASSKRQVRIGVTELTALTWLARFVTAMQREFPRVSVEPAVEHSRTLLEQLAHGSFDFIVVPDIFSEQSLQTIRIGEVANAWMARPGLVKSRRALSIVDLAAFPLLVQGSRSGSGLFYMSWFRNQGAIFDRTISTDSLVALIGLTIAGVGVSYLPRDAFMPLVNESKLAVIRTKPELPPVPYAILRRKEPMSRSMEAIVDLVRGCCDFGLQFQT